MAPKIERMNLRMEKPLRDWIKKAARLSKSPNDSEFARRILQRAYEQRHSDRKRLRA